ncbi:MAG: hypothetical protein QM817_01770 [Archangium sp.]
MIRISDPARATNATQLMIIAFIANIGLILLGYVVIWLFPQAWGGPWQLVEELLWLAFSGVLVVALMMLGSVLIEHKTLAFVAAAFWIISSLSDLGATLLMQLQQGDRPLTLLPGALQTVYFDFSIVLTLVARALLFGFFVRLTLESRAWVLPMLVVAWLVSAARLVTSIAVSHMDRGYELYRTEAWRIGSVLATFVSAISALVAAMAVHSVVRGVSATPATAQAGLVPPPVVEPVSAGADFAIGGIILAVGIGVTVVSMEAASNGGRYVVATGAIAVGIARIIRGLIRLGKR